MSNEREDLARRAVACKHWRWMPGMRDANGDTVVMVKFGVPYVFCWDESGQAACASTLALPDLTDPCTLGGLLALVREAYGQPLAFCQRININNYVEVNPVWHITTGHVGETKAAALVTALEAAP